VGVVPQQIAPGDIYPALERGAIDAVEYIGPYDDEKLGFHKVAKYYYTPGWQEGGTLFHVMASLEKWDSLPPAYKKAVEVAAQATTATMLAHYDTKNPDAMLRLGASGVQISLFPQDVSDLRCRARALCRPRLQQRSLCENLRFAEGFQRQKLPLSSRRRLSVRYDHAHAPAQALAPQPSVPLGAGVGAPDEGVERWRRASTPRRSATSRQSSICAKYTQGR
jgi:hypothetical protein